MSSPTLVFSILAPPEDPKNAPNETIVAKLEKKESTVVVTRETFEYVYTLESLDEYKHWLLLILRDIQGKTQNSAVKISGNLGVGDVVVGDFRDVTEIVGKILDLLKGAISTTQT